MRKLGIITDSTPVSKKKNAKNWDTFGDLSEKIILESSQWDRQSRVRSGLAKNAMLLRALLVSTIAVMCVLIFYTLQNYNFLCEYISGVEENNEIFFDIEVSTSVDTRNFANIMLLAMLAASFLQSLKWAKSAFLSAYALSPSFRLSFSSENSYRWFIFRPFKTLRKIYYASSDKLGKRVSLGDKIFFFCATIFEHFVSRANSGKQHKLHIPKLIQLILCKNRIFLPCLYTICRDMRGGALDYLHYKD